MNSVQYEINKVYFELKLLMKLMHRFIKEDLHSLLETNMFINQQNGNIQLLNTCIDLNTQNEEATSTSPLLRHYFVCLLN